jgi:hypothetical protein
MNAPIETELALSETTLSQAVLKLEVTSQETYDLANHVIDECNVVLGRISAHHDPMIKAAYSAHKTAVAAKKRLADRFEAIKKDAACKMTAWYMAEQRRVQEERQKAEEQARRDAEEARLREAVALEKVGMGNAAAAALDMPLNPAEFIKEQAAGPIAGDGVFYRVTWKATVIDLMKLVKAVAEGKAPIAYLEANMTALNAAAKSYRNTLDIPGVLQYNEPVQSKRKHA